MVRRFVQSLWAEPRAAHPPERVWRDWVLVAVLAPTAVLEAILREGLAWRPAALALGVVPVFALLRRRTDPLVVVLLVFGAQTAADVATLFGAGGPATLYTSAYVLLLPYSLLRWGSGRQVAIGMVFILACDVFRESVNSSGDVLLGALFFLFSAALGAAVRYRASSRARETEQIQLREREQLARELHDTVAHHVSAIAIQAQAGRTVAASRPGAALEALAVIEAEASRTLAEMRSLVGALRRDDDVDLTPRRGVADIERIADGVGNGLRVEVQRSGELDDLRPLVDAAIYRLAQESITNAVRHARHATRVEVRVSGEDDCVRLTVCDDGGPAAIGSISSSGYGLAGMAERAALLGGTLEAGPGREPGWTVRAVLPREGSPK